MAYQRLDLWLWCARFARQRAACAQLAATGMIRINGIPTNKPHARIRPGDVLTLPMRAGVRVVRILALSERRSTALEARALYEDVPPPCSPCAGG